MSLPFATSHKSVVLLLDGKWFSHPLKVCFKNSCHSYKKYCTGAEQDMEFLKPR